MTKRNERQRPRATTMARRERALTMMIAGASDREVAIAVRVREQSVRRWRMDPIFRERLESAIEAAAAAANETVSEILQKGAVLAARRLVRRPAIGIAKTA